MRTLRTALALGATSALALTLAACSGGSGPSGDLTWEDSPLFEYTSVGYDPNESQEEANARYEIENAKREEIIAQCMVDEGFEYTPNVSNFGGVVLAGDEVEWEPTKKEWVEKYGYGIVNNPWNEYWEQNQPEEPEEYVDPNGDYIASLSPSEQEAYYEVLYGKQDYPETDEEAESWVYDWTKAGCQGKADHETYGDQQGVWEQFSDLNESMSKIYDKVADDPDLIELNNKWATCMADAGYSDFKKKDDAQTSFYDKVNKIYESFTEDDWANGDPSKDNPEMIELGKEEIETALADLECSKDLDYDNAFMRAQFKLEEKFVAENKAELEEFKAALEQAQKK